jgi:hypothetical protein
MIPSVGGGEKEHTHIIRGHGIKHIQCWPALNALHVFTGIFVTPNPANCDYPLSNLH